MIIYRTKTGHIELRKSKSGWQIEEFSDGKCIDWWGLYRTKKQAMAAAKTLARVHGWTKEEAGK